MYLSEAAEVVDSVLSAGLDMLVNEEEAVIKLKQPFYKQYFFFVKNVQTTNWTVEIKVPYLSLLFYEMGNERRTAQPNLPPLCDAPLRLWASARYPLPSALPSLNLLPSKRLSGSFASRRLESETWSG